MTELQDPITSPQPTESTPPATRIPEKQMTRRSRIKTFRDLIRGKDSQIANQQSQISLTDAEKAEAEKLARIDALTGLPNRRAFDERYALEVARNRRTGRKSTVIVLDADRLKLINDTMGHDAGDEYIRKIAKALSDGIRRETDFVARTGGDEFIAILGETDLDGAEKAWIETFDPAFQQNVISISGGGAIIDVNDPEESIKAADRAMYGAKRDQNKNGENLLYLHNHIKK